MTPQESSLVPPSVKAVSKRADELFKAQFKQQDVPEVTSGGNDPAPEQNAPAPQAQPPASPAPSGGMDPSEAERKYLGEKGRREELERRLREAQESLVAVQRRLDELEASRPPAQTQQPVETPRLVTKQEEEEYTPEFLDLVRRAAREEILPVLSKVDTTFSTIDRRVQSIAQHTAQTDRQKMYEYLDKQVANWREINRSEDFLSWLNDFQPLTRQMRSDLLQSAYGANDGPRVAQFFTEFLRERGALAPQSPPPAPKRKPGVTLEDLAAPGRAGSVAPNTPTDTAFIKRSDISAFYAAVTKGAYKANPKLRAEIESQIDKAVAEGRVIN